MQNKKNINLNYNSKIPVEIDNLQYVIRQFPCGEYEFSIQENIEGMDINIYQTFSVGNFNDELMELQIICDVLKRNNVENINYFSPFLPYTRQDRTYNMTGSLGARLVAEIINNCGINKITTYDFHTLQIEGFFKGQVFNLSAIPLFLENIKKHFNAEDIIIVFPDVGACNRFKRFFEGTEYDIAIINKIRKEKILNMKVLGDVSNKVSIIIDDMIDSGSTIIEASKMLKNNGLKDIFVYSTHGVLSGDAVEKLTNTEEISKIIITNSIIQNKNLSEKFEVINL